MAGDDRSDYENANWDLVLFHLDGRVIKKVSIELFERKAAGFAHWSVGDKRFVFESDDPRIAKTLTMGLNMPLRIAFPNGPGGAGPGGYGFGRMLVSTTKDNFVVGITTGGFSLGSDTWQVKRVFFSWPAAKQIDDVLFEKTGKRLPDDVFRSLSGQAWIDDRKKAYEEIWREPACQPARKLRAPAR